MAGVAAVRALDTTLVNLILGSSVAFDMTSMDAVSGGSTVYHGTVTGGGSDAFSGQEFMAQNFYDARNTGNFPCTASTATSLTLTNGLGTAEAFSGQAIYVKGASATGAGSPWGVPGHPMGGRYSNFTWSTVFTGSPSSVSISIEGSNDGNTWQIIATSTATAGESQYVGFNPFQFLRAAVTTLDTGTVAVYLTLGC